MPDPDLEIRGRPSHQDPNMGGSPPNFFRPFKPQFGLKIRGALAPQAPSLDPPLRWKNPIQVIIIFLTTMFFLDLLWLLWVHLFIAQLPPSPGQCCDISDIKRTHFHPLCSKFNIVSGWEGGRLPVLLIIITGKVPTYLMCIVSDAILSSFSSCQKCSQI